MEHKKRSKGSVWEFCYANKIFGTFGDEIKACGQKLVKFCAHTHAAKLVVEISVQQPNVSIACSVHPNTQFNALLSLFLSGLHITIEVKILQCKIKPILAL